MKEIGQIIPSASGKPESKALAPIGKAPRDVGFSGMGAIPTLPEATPAMRYLLSRIASPNVGMDSFLVPAEAKAPAERRLRLLQARMRPATVDDWEAFLFPLTNPDIVANPIPANELPKRVRDIAFAMGEVPACVLSVKNQRALCQKAFFPRPHDLTEVLGPDIREARGEAFALKRIIDKAPEPEPERDEGPRAPLIGQPVGEPLPPDRKPGVDRMPPLPKALPPRPAGVLGPDAARAMAARGEKIPDASDAALRQAFAAKASQVV